MNPDEIQNPDQKPKGILRTFSSDMGEAVVSGEGRIVRQAIIEDAAQEAAVAEVSIKTPKNTAYVIGSAVLIFVALGAIIYSLPKLTTVSVVQTQKVSSIIVAENTKEFIVTDTDPVLLRQKIGIAVTNLEPMTENAMYLYLTNHGLGGTTIMQAIDFLTRIDAHVPDSFKKILVPRWMIGEIASNATLQTPYILFEVSEYTDAAAGMNVWETKLFDDMYDILSIDAGAHPELFTNRFSSDVIANKYVRVLRRADGTVALVYGFLNDTTIGISTSAEGFSALVAQFFAKRS